MISQNPGSGTLLLHGSNQSAEIEIDGRHAGTLQSGDTLRVRLSSGSHEVRVLLRGRVVGSRSVQIVANQTIDLFIPVPASSSGYAGSARSAEVSYSASARNGSISDKNKWVAFLLCVFFGCLGFHRFYVGKAGTGVLWLFSLGLAGIGVIVDCISILMGSFTDKYGNPLK